MSLQAITTVKHDAANHQRGDPIRHIERLILRHDHPTMVHLLTTNPKGHPMTLYSQRVKQAFVHTYGHGGKVNVPANARTQSATAQGGGFRWVDPATYPANSIERHDAEHYGIRVYPDNIESLSA